jgi:DNA-binding NarL/FixJ family response regulator
MYTSERTTRILIADDHPVMREGLRSMLEGDADLRVIAQAGDGLEATDLFRLHRPDVSLIDLQMPNLDGLGAIGSIRAECPDASIVVLTTYPGDARVASALSLGAVSYILKTSTRAEIIAAVRAAAHGRMTLGPEVLREVCAYRGTETLSPREIRVLKLIAAGKKNRCIGEQLHVSEQTVKTRVRTILAKLDAHDRTHAVTIALRRGFIDNGLLTTDK